MQCASSTTSRAMRTRPRAAGNAALPSRSGARYAHRGDRRCGLLLTGAEAVEAESRAQGVKKTIVRGPGKSGHAQVSFGSARCNGVRERWSAFMTGLLSRIFLAGIIPNDPPNLACRPVASSTLRVASHRPGTHIDPAGWHPRWRRTWGIRPDPVPPALPRIPLGRTCRPRHGADPYPMDRTP